MHFFHVGGLVWSVSTTNVSTTTLASGVITIDGGPNATANIVGSHNDPADLYGIVLVGLAIALALVATRWLFGRGGRGAR
ncbi:MAG: hypothetical protein M0Z30_05025 [Actinomycetota bacterium]|nr:hypothetical protein [Actinomycetota bacterium]